MIDIFKNKLHILKSNLSERQLRDIHYQSVYNFPGHFNRSKNESMQIEIINYLAQYFKDIVVKGYAKLSHSNF